MKPHEFKREEVRQWSLPLGYDTSKPEHEAYRHGPILGGLGTGWISFNGAGLCNENIYNLSNLNGSRPGSFFAVRTETEGRKCLRFLQDYAEVGPVQGRDVRLFGHKLVEKAVCRSLPPALQIDYFDRELPVNISATAFSPTVPDEYENSSLPVGVFLFRVQNPTKNQVDVTLVGSFQNDVGYLDLGGYKSCTAQDFAGEKTQGILMGNDNPDLKPEHRGEILIAAAKDAGEISMYKAWSVTENGESFFSMLYDHGVLLYNYKAGDMYSLVPEMDHLLKKKPSEAAQASPKAGAVAVKVTLAPGEEKVIPFFLSWYFPMLSLHDAGYQCGRYAGGKMLIYDKDGWYRQFTKFADSAAAVVERAARDYPAWWQAVRAWHARLTGAGMPEWMQIKYAFELSYLLGWTYWMYQKKADGTEAHNYFVVQEAQFRDCPSTTDVDGYNWLVLLWPRLENQEIREIGWAQHDTGKIPHDLQVVTRPNQGHQEGWYTIRNFQNFVFSRDLASLKENWPVIKRAFRFQLEHCIKQDTHLLYIDHNGSGGYDSWPCDGHPAYINSQWLLELKLLAKFARFFNEEDLAREAEDVFAKAQASYIKELWVDKGDGYPYFKFGSGDVFDADCCQNEQLTGVFYANILGGVEILPAEKVKAALTTIYKKLYIDGYGWLCGRFTDGTIPMQDPTRKDIKIMQSARIRGVAQWNLASTLVQIGMLKEGLHVADYTYKFETGTDLYTLWTYPYYTAGFDTEGNFQKWFTYVYPSYPRTGFLGFMLSCAGVVGDLDGLHIKPRVDFGKGHGYFFKWGDGILTMRVEAPVNRIKSATVNGTPAAYDQEKGLFLPESLSTRESNVVVLG